MRSSGLLPPVRTLREVVISEIAQAIRGYRFTYATEAQLEDGIAEALQRGGFDVRRQVVLEGLGRIDLLVGSVGIEVKIAGATPEVSRQLDRYLESPAIEGIVLVTGRSLHQVLQSDQVEVVTLGLNAL